MTKVQLNYDLVKPLTEKLMERMASATSLFGLLRVQAVGAGDRLEVDYDASRLTRDQVEAALHGLGLAVRQKS